MRREWDVIPVGFGEGRYAKAATSGPALLASRLALAVTHGIPFHDALLSLTVYGVPLQRWSGLSFFKYRDWDFCLRAAAYDLCNGLPLSKALQRLHYFLPAYYLAGVAEAEQHGLLEKSLPAFADSMQFCSEIRNGFWQNAAYPLVELMLMLPIISALSIFIAPKFAKILCELLEGAPGAWLWIRYFSGLGYGLLTCFFAFLFLYMLLRRFRWEVMMYLELLLWFLPFCRRQIKAVGMMELAAAMQASLNSGMDVVGAVDFSRKSSRHFWLRRRLARCGKQLSAGVPLTKAWQEVAGNDEMSSFFVDSAGGSENLSGAFAAMGEWSAEISVRTARINSIWLMMLLLAINVALVFSFEYVVFRSLITIIDKLAGIIW